MYNFREFSAERDSDFVKCLYHNISAMRIGFRGWVLEEIKEIKIEATRAREYAHAAQRNQLDSVCEQLDVFEKHYRVQYMEDNTPEMDQARDSVWADVSEPGSAMLKQFSDLLQLAAILQEIRESLETITENYNL